MPALLEAIAEQNKQQVLGFTKTCEDESRVIVTTPSPDDRAQRATEAARYLARFIPSYIDGIALWVNEVEGTLRHGLNKNTFTKLIKSGSDYLNACQDLIGTAEKCSGPQKLDSRISYCWLSKKGVIMARKRKSHTAAFKAQVALAAVKGDKTISELARLHGVHPTMIHAWKKQLVEQRRGVVQSGAKTSGAEHEALQAQLYEQIGRLKTELDWLKKKAASFG